MSTIPLENYKKMCYYYKQGNQVDSSVLQIKLYIISPKKSNYYHFFRKKVLTYVSPSCIIWSVIHRSERV